MFSSFQIFRAKPSSCIPELRILSIVGDEMRITSASSEINNLSGERFKMPFRVGDVIKGRIVDISSGSVILKTSEQQFINAAILRDNNIKKDSLVEIIITKISEDKVYAQFLEANSGEQTVKNEIPNILETLGVSGTELNIDIFKRLIEHRQPVNKDIFDYINYLIKAVDPFKNGSLREILALVFSKEDILNIPLHKLFDLILSADADGIIDTESLQEYIKSGNIADAEKIISENYELDEMGLVKLGQLFSGAHKAVNSLKEANVRSLIFMISKDIDITAENLSMYNEINNNSEAVSKRIDNIIRHLSSIDDSQIQSIKADLSEVFLKPEDFSMHNVNVKFKKLVNLLTQLESSLDAKDINNYETRETLMDLRNIMNLIKSINDHINYVHIPITINNTETDVKIFVYEKGKRSSMVDTSNINILVCLNTENLGYIESYIEMRNKSLNIKFSSEDKIASDLINRYRGILIEALQLKGYNTDIYAVEKKDHKANLEYMEELLNSKEVSGYSIDVRV